jgi:hypothetical protein
MMAIDSFLKVWQGAIAFSLLMLFDFKHNNHLILPANNGNNNNATLSLGLLRDRMNWNISEMLSKYLQIGDDKKLISATVDTKTQYPNNLTIVSFVNGIFYTEDDMERIGRQLSNTFDCSFRPFYSPSTGNWAADVSSVSMQLIAQPNDFDLAKNLAKHLKQLISEVGEHGRVLHIAHSGGAILTYLAAKHHLTKRERNQLDVITFGAGHSLTRKYFRGRLVNYYARNDPCVYVDKRALQLGRSPSVVASFLQILQNQSNHTFVEIFDSKHNTSFVFMHGITGHPIRDHSMEGPTYKLALAREAQELIQRRNDIRMKLLLYQQKETNKIRKIRKYFSRLTGRRRFAHRVSQDIVDMMATIRHSSTDLWRMIETGTANLPALKNESTDYWELYVSETDTEPDL